MNGWTNTGKSFQGDTSFSTWATDGTVYFPWNDGWGASNSGAAAGGCSANVGMTTISSDLETIAQKNCMSSYGMNAQTNTGGWSDGKTWKSGGLVYINDGSTSTGLYWNVMRQLDMPPWTRANASIVYSSDGGTTWCAPGHSGGSCATNGDAPAANTAEFTSLPTMYFVEYEQGASGTLTVDCQNSWIYAYGITGDYSASYLMRAARGSNLQSAGSWTYYSGTAGGDACSSGNWNSSFGSATQLGGGSLTEPSSSFSVVYIPNYGYLAATASNVFFYSSQSVTGPWTLVYNDTLSGSLYSFVHPMLNTLSVDGGGNISMYVYFGGSSSRDTNTGSTPYSAFFRKLFINNPHP